MHLSMGNSIEKIARKYSPTPSRQVNARIAYRLEAQPKITKFHLFALVNLPPIINSHTLYIVCSESFDVSYGRNFKTACVYLLASKRCRLIFIGKFQSKHQKQIISIKNASFESFKRMEYRSKL